MRLQSSYRRGSVSKLSHGVHSNRVFASQRGLHHVQALLLLSEGCNCLGCEKGVQLSGFLALLISCFWQLLQWLLTITYLLCLLCLLILSYLRNALSSCFLCFASVLALLRARFASRPELYLRLLGGWWGHILSTQSWLWAWLRLSLNLGTWWCLRRSCWWLLWGLTIECSSPFLRSG